MKAIIIKDKKGVILENIPQPESVSAEYLIIKMEYMGINAGDHVLISGELAPGFFPESRYSVAGVSGVGRVIETGDGVPEYYKDKLVTVYRSLKFGEQIIGTWTEYAHLHYLQCAVLPDNADPKEYSGSLVNIITPYAFLKQAESEGHKGIIITAGNSATGIAMLGFCLAYNIPVISIVRNAKGKKELEMLGAQHILIQDESDYKKKLQELSTQLKTTAIFDGTGGSVLNDMMDVIPFGSTIYAYGFLGGSTPLSFHTGILMKEITIKGFANHKTDTVKDPKNLENALKEISRLIHMPHFKTKSGVDFTLEQIDEAMRYSSPDSGKAILKIV